MISAIGWSGPPEECLDLSMEGIIINFITKPIIEELIAVMDYPKFKFEEKEKEQFLEVLLANSVLVEPKENINIIKQDLDDNKFLECAVEAHADYIISGDRHLVKLQRFRGIDIVSPREFLSEL